MQWKPLSDPERILEICLWVPWVETSDDERPKMFEGIISKEYPTDHMDGIDVAVISQQDRTKDSEDKQLVKANLQRSADSRESG